MIIYKNRNDLLPNPREQCYDLDQCSSLWARPKDLCNQHCLSHLIPHCRKPLRRRFCRWNQPSRTSVTSAPSSPPTPEATTSVPTSEPTSVPTTSQPTQEPTAVNPAPSSSPTPDPTTPIPTSVPTTFSPTAVTPAPVTPSPTSGPTSQPNPLPTTSQPTVEPTAVTPAPTNSPQETPQPTEGELVVDQKHRCGPSELHARETCGKVCETSADCSADEWCWGVHPNYCGSIPKRVYVNPSQSSVWTRCGKSEIDARSFCGEPCTWQCSVAGETCMAVNSNYCDSDYYIE